MKILQWFFQKLVGVECQSDCGNFYASVQHEIRTGKVFTEMEHEGHYFAVHGYADDPDELRRRWANFAGDQDLSLDWMAAAYMCKMIREEVG